MDVMQETGFIMIDHKTEEEIQQLQDVAEEISKTVKKPKQIDQPKETE